MISTRLLSKFEASIGRECEKMSVYVITHKQFQSKSDPFYKVLLVGAYKGHIFGDCFDDIGDQISEKNPTFCELTGCYWIMKNVKDEYVGLTHYRRYFSSTFGINRILTEEEIMKKLAKHDIILPFKQTLPVSLNEHYCQSSGKSKDLELLRNIIEQDHNAYLQDYDSVMNDNQAYFFNMMICRREVFNQYHEWLFDILFKLEKLVDTSDYDDYQKRIYGFLSERLLNVWVLHHHLNVFEVGVINTEERWSVGKKLLTGMKRWLLFRIKL